MVFSRSRLLLQHQIFQERMVLVLPEFVSSKIKGKRSRRPRLWPSNDGSMVCRLTALPMYWGARRLHWYRLCQSLGTSVHCGDNRENGSGAPPHLVADEKHCDWSGNRAYLAVTAAPGCILGASLSTSAGQDGLTNAYGGVSAGSGPSCPRLYSRDRHHRWVGRHPGGLGIVVPWHCLDSLLSP